MMHIGQSVATLRNSKSYETLGVAIWNWRRSDNLEFLGNGGRLGARQKQRETRFLAQVLGQTFFLYKYVITKKNWYFGTELKWAHSPVSNISGAQPKSAQIYFLGCKIQAANWHYCVQELWSFRVVRPGCVMVIGLIPNFRPTKACDGSKKHRQ